MLDELDQQHTTAAAKRALKAVGVLTAPFQAVAPRAAEATAARFHGDEKATHHALPSSEEMATSIEVFHAIRLKLHRLYERRARAATIGSPRPHGNLRMG
jgi:hypothetical protein